MAVALVDVLGEAEVVEPGECVLSADLVAPVYSPPAMGGEGEEAELRATQGTGALAGVAATAPVVEAPEVALAAGQVPLTATRASTAEEVLA